MVSQQQFKLLFDTYFEDVRRYVLYLSGNEEVAVDIAQDTFLRIWEKQMDLDPERVKGLFFKIARDMYLVKFKREKLAFQFFNTFIPAENTISPENELNYKELKFAYEAALKSMPENHRVVFLLSRIDELKYREIAERLGLSIKAVEKRMNRALSHMKKCLL